MAAWWASDLEGSDNDFSPMVAKPASLEPVCCGRKIHQHFPAASVMADLGRSESS